MSFVEASEPPPEPDHVYDLPTELAFPQASRPRRAARLLLVAAMLALGFSVGAGVLLAHTSIHESNRMQARTSLRVAGVRERVSIRAALPSPAASKEGALASPGAKRKIPTVIFTPAPKATAPTVLVRPTEHLPQLPVATEPVADDLLADSRTMLDDRL